ncbi:unnamed protein product [Cunninghamella blakesleeana]
MGSTHTSEKHPQALNPLPAMPPVPPLFKPGNPAAIGFSSFAVGSFVLGLYSTGLITNLPQIAVGVALGFTGVSQFVSGLLELLIGNTFAGTTMLTYSGFFFSFGLTFSPATGFLQAIAAEGEEALEFCVGLFMLAYTIPSFLFFLGTFRQPILIRVLLFQVFLGFLFSCLGAFLHMKVLTAVGGWITLSLAINAWYIMCTFLFDDTTTTFKLPMF